MLTVHELRLAFDGQPVLRGIDLEVRQGEILCLLGPSGCGKTTLLRTIAGLEQPDSGDILLNGASILPVPVHRRDFGLMFQDFALFPHMDVAENITFGLKVRGLSWTAQHERLQAVLTLVGLLGFERRDVTQLSGGERQRVALARSLAPNPHLLMLDEPLGSLDATLREHLVVELRAVIKRVGLTAIYVTHDQREAFAVADRLAVMNAGRIEQVDVPEAVYQRPQTAFVARFLGLNNIVPVTAFENGCAKTPVGEFDVAEKSESLLLHPDGIEIAGAGGSHAILGRVRERVFQGDTYRISVEHESGLTITFQAASKAPHIPVIGELVALRIAPDHVIPLLTAAEE